jgi:hypothetical protein
MDTNFVLRGEEILGSPHSAYLEGVSAPSLSPGQIVVMDNLPAHKGCRVREIVEGRGCELSYNTVKKYLRRLDAAG